MSPRRFLLLFGIVSTITPSLSAQLLLPGTCNTEVIVPASVQRGGRFMPSSGTLKVLFIYLQFPDDNYRPDSPNWPKGQAPTYMSATVDQTWSANATPGGFTDYFNLMSSNSLKIIGTSISRVTPNTRQHYLDQGMNSTDIYTEVLQQLDQTMDFAQFDNWRWSVEYTMENSPDNVVDMIIMMWRDIHSVLPYTQRRQVQDALHLVPGGEASLGGDYDLGAPPIYVDGGPRRIEMCYPTYYSPDRPGSGVTVIQPDSSDLSSGTFWTYARHEFAHYLLGGNEYHTQLGTWGMLSGWGSPGQCINSFERYKLGWINFNDITDVTTPREIVPFLVGFSDGDAYSGKFSYAAFVCLIPAFFTASVSRAARKTDIDL